MPFFLCQVPLFLAGVSSLVFFGELSVSACGMAGFFFKPLSFFSVFFQGGLSNER